MTMGTIGTVGTLGRRTRLGGRARQGQGKTRVQTDYGVDEDTAGLLLLVFPLLYVFLSIPAGVLSDRKGYPFAIGLSAVLMALSACVRVIDGGFTLLLTA